jgi:uncharacterized protein with HEPN domain
MPPDERVAAWLWDIEAAAAAIARFTDGLNLETYAGSEQVTAAVERKFEIIGEALGQMQKAAPEVAERITNFRQIIAFRNLLIHGYAVIQHDRVFQIARDSLPTLRAEVTTLLRGDDAN